MKHSAFPRFVLPLLGFLFSGSVLFSPSSKVEAAANDYYASIDWSQSGATLKTALSKLIRPHTNVGYNGLWEVYLSSDVRPDGKIWDMYSDQTNYVPGGSAQGKNYSKEGDSYNREHTIPQSVFKEASPMKADAFHVYPTDGYVNNRRGTYPHADVGEETWSSHNSFVKIGKSSDPGISGTVCEVADEYKGDFARTYFYFVTCYQNEMKSGNWGSYAPFSTSSALGLNASYLAVYLRWSNQDPVSQKEIDRNEAVYAFQKNRNPFIDHPEAIEKIWGNGGSSSSSSSSVSTHSSSSGVPSSASSEPVFLESIRTTGSWTVPFGGKPQGEVRIFADYSNGTSKDITSLVTIPPLQNKVLGKQIITVTYQGKTASFEANVTNQGTETGEVAIDQEITIQPKTANHAVTYASSDSAWSVSQSSSGINTSVDGDFVNLGSSKNAGSIMISSAKSHWIRQVKLAVAPFHDETPIVTCEIGSVSRSLTMNSAIKEMCFDFGDGLHGDAIKISNDGGKRRIQILSFVIACQEGKGPAFTAEEQALAWANYFLAKTDTYQHDVWLHLGDEYRAMTDASIAYYQANKASEATLQQAENRYQELRKCNFAWDFQGNASRPTEENPSSSSSLPDSLSSLDVNSSSDERNSVTQDSEFHLWPIFVAVGVVLILGALGLFLWLLHRKK